MCQMFGLFAVTFTPTGQNMTFDAKLKNSFTFQQLFLQNSSRPAILDLI